MIPNKVLIPLDGSERSLQVLPHILRHLKAAQTELVLFYVADEPTFYAGDGSNEDTIVYADQEAATSEAAFRDAMQAHIHKLISAGFAVTTDVRFGEPVSEIERYIAEERVTLVAMTTHGRTGLARLLLGSVAQHVVNHAAVPVLLYCADRVTAAVPVAQWEVAPA